jgi:F0F1-type ATP synthase membrane subunit b/b'
MVEQNVLQHLLQIEAQAAALVDDAQAEADRRISEGEKKARAQYESQYSQKQKYLETDYSKHKHDTEKEYRRLLEAYREEINLLPVDKKSFSSLAEDFLFGDA